jgi:hypothetical protein
MDGLQRPLDDHDRRAYQFISTTTNVSTIGVFGLRALGGESQHIFDPVPVNAARIEYQRLYDPVAQPAYVIHSLIPSAVFNLPVSRAGGYRTRELEWRRTNSQALRPFAGQWVALEGEEIISHGPDPVAVANQARARGITTPYIFYVESLARDVIRIGL